MTTLAENFLLLTAFVGLTLSSVSGYLIIRGPFLGGPTLAPIPLFQALVSFIVGIVLLAWGGTRYARSRL